MTVLIIFQSACFTKGISENSNKNNRFRGRQNRVKGEYLVKLRDSAEKKDIEISFKDYEIIEIKLIKKRLYKLKIKKDPGPAILQKRAKKSGKFEYIEPNCIYRLNPPKAKKKLQRIEK